MFQFQVLLSLALPLPLCTYHELTPPCFPHPRLPP